MEMVKREIEMLESLADMQLATDIMKPSKSADEEIHILDSRFRQLNMQEMTPLKPKTAEFQEIHAYLQNSTGHTHGFAYKTHDIFRIARQVRAGAPLYINQHHVETVILMLWQFRVRTIDSPNLRTRTSQPATGVSFGMVQDVPISAEY